MTEPLVVKETVIIPARELSWSATRAGGPGGQNVNKVSSKVELRFDLEGSTVLDGRVKSKLRALAGGRIDKTGTLLIVSQRTRDQQRNLEDAREKLAELIRAALTPEKRRRATRPTRASKTRRLDEKRHEAKKKDARKTRDD